MSKDIEAYNAEQTDEDKLICDVLRNLITTGLPSATCKVWHGHPVWFLKDNPVVGYSKQKKGICLLFWSGQSFNEDGLSPEGSFKAAQVHYTNKDQINTDDLERWLKKAEKIQWDYKNIVKKRGQLERL